MKKPAATLAALRRTCTDEELRALFAHIRGHSDAALLGHAKPAAPARAASLAKAVGEALDKVLAPAGEKGLMLFEHLTGSGSSRRFRGIADAVRALRRLYSEDEILAGARALAGQLAKSHSMRETVV